MVLFYCGHPGLLWQCISIRCHRYTNEKIVLLIASNFSRSSFAKKLIDLNIFENIYTVRMGFSFQEESIEKQEQKILDYFDACAEKNNIDFNNFSDIFIIQDINGEFPVYLSMKDIPYIIIEDSALPSYSQLDDLRRYSAHEKITKLANSSYTAVLEKHKALCGSGDICKKRLRRENGRKASAHDMSLPKDEWLDFDLLFNIIPDEYKNIIGRCLLDENIDSLQEKDSCLVLPNSHTLISVDTKLDYSHIHLVHQIALDYYIHNDEARIFVKNHPNSNRNEVKFNKYIEADEIFNIDIPIEFYRFIPNFSINKVLSIATTALDKIGDCVRENIRLGASYYWYFRLCHKLFFAFSLHVKLNKGKTVCNWAKGVNAEFIHNFARYCFDDFPNYEPQMKFGWQSLKGDNFIIIDEVPPENKKDLIIGLEGADPLTKIVFLNSKKDFAFFALEHFDLLEYITPFVIKKTAVSDTCISDTDDEMLFFFCKDKAVRDTAKTFTVRKSLKYTKLSLEISAVNIEDMYPSLYRHEAVSRLQEINRAFEAQDKRTSAVVEQVVKLETSQQTAYEDLSKSLNENKARVDELTNSYDTLNDRLTQTAERLGGEIQQNETRTSEELGRLYQGFDSRLNDVVHRVENTENHLSETVERLSAEIRQSETRISERLERLYQGFDSRLNDVVHRVENTENHLSETVERLSAEMRKNETRTEERITQAVSEIKGLYRSLLMSNSWRIGQAVTWLPRKMSGLFRHK